MENTILGVMLITALLKLITKSSGEPYNKTKIKVLEFTYPPGSTDMPIANWETQASLTMDNFPDSINMCTSVYIKSMVADTRSDIKVFTIEDPDKDFEQWLLLKMMSGTDLTSFMIWIGPKGHKSSVACKESMPIFFPKFWTRVCMSVNFEDGAVRVVVNGRILENRIYPEMKKLQDKKPSRLTIRLGKQDNGINSKWTDLNMFNSPQDVKKMVAMTTSGSTECGTPGDFLKWEDTEWVLKGRKGTKEWGSEVVRMGVRTDCCEDYILMIDSAKVTESAFEDGPCWRQSEIMVYQVNIMVTITVFTIIILITSSRRSMTTPTACATVQRSLGAAHLL